MSEREFHETSSLNHYPSFTILRLSHSDHIVHCSYISHSSYLLSSNTLSSGVIRPFDDFFHPPIVTSSAVTSPPPFLDASSYTFMEGHAPGHLSQEAGNISPLDYTFFLAEVATKFWVTGSLNKMKYLKQNQIVYSGNVKVACHGSNFV